MLFRQPFLEGIRSGRVTVAFRRWRRPSVRAGGTLLTPVGQLSIVSVTPVTLDQITAAEARRAGYASPAVLVAELQRHTEGVLYRIELGPVRPDPRVALRQTALGTDAERHALRDQLHRLDMRSPHGPWTVATLELLAVSSGVRAGNLADRLGQDVDRFKRNVRHLKRLGLTESLGTGYRLSARGQAFVDALQSGDLANTT